MRRVFLGPALHWLVILGLIGLGWVSGLDRMHVTTFNPFLIVLLIVTVVVLLIVLKTSPEGKQVTREPLEDEE